MHNGLDISFENLHKTHKKCTPLQHSYYELALSLFNKLNSCRSNPCFETITIFFVLKKGKNTKKLEIFFEI